MVTVLSMLVYVMGRGRGRVPYPLRRSDRGDVPGWVLITLMTAGIVAVLWGVAQGDLQSLFDNAMKSVKGPSGN